MNKNTVTDRTYAEAFPGYMNKNTDTINVVTARHHPRRPVTKAPCAMLAVWRRSKASDKQSVVLLEYQSQMPIVRINGKIQELAASARLEADYGDQNENIHF